MSLTNYLNATTNPVYCIQVITPAGCPLHYTGKAGEGWLSPRVEDAFPFQTIEGAFRKMGVFAKTNYGKLIFNVIDARTGEYMEEA